MTDEKETLVPTLTLDPFEGEGDQSQAPVPAAPQPESEADLAEESKLSPEEKKMVDEFASKINLTNSNMILQYGSGAQKKMAEFSESALSSVRTKDLGEVGEALTSVIGELKSFENAEEEKGFLGMFKRTSNKIEAMKAKYSKAETNVTRICEVLENHQIQLLKDVAMLDQMYEKNKVYFKELSMYILAGKQKLAEARAKDLPALMEAAKASNLPEDAQTANDMAALCDRFEKKLHDLELTRTISLQMAPQIRLIQNNDTLMSDKIQSTLVNTIPLWKSQMVLALGIAHSQQAAKAQHAVSDMTNELLKKNADTLKMATIETAKESERGIVDIETLKSTNQTLISTLDEVSRIQAEGRQKRAAAETELANIESDLKKKLLELRS